MSLPDLSPDPLRRPIRPQDIPLRSPMPRSAILDREEPELTDEPDIPDESFAD